MLEGVSTLGACIVCSRGLGAPVPWLDVVFHFCDSLFAIL